MEQELKEINPNGVADFLAPSFASESRHSIHDVCATERRLDEKRLRDLYYETYRAEPFVKILPSGQIATLNHSVNTNYCTISIHHVADVQQAIICASIDNLIKGASGQAVQNMNLLCLELRKRQDYCNWTQTNADKRR